MAEHGGYRKPEHPAPVSGPGRLSKRTDGGPSQPLRNYTGGSYGDGVAMSAQQHGAAMSNTAADMSNPPAASAAAPPAPVYGGNPAPSPGAFNRPAEMNVPATSGIDMGMGAGAVMPGGAPAAPVQGGGVGPMTALLGQLNLSGDLSTLYQAAAARGV